MARNRVANNLRCFLAWFQHANLEPQLSMWCLSEAVQLKSFWKMKNCRHYNSIWYLPYTYEKSELSLSHLGAGNYNAFSRSMQETLSRLPHKLVLPFLRLGRARDESLELFQTSPFNFAENNQTVSYHVKLANYFPRHLWKKARW